MRRKNTEELLSKAIKLLEDVRAFVLRFDELDEDEIAYARKISRFLETTKGAI